jgi:alkanesulfonate monooxygenase SsuD/methylene tetrahydromethanopterin reductase-like flavin-dependent oxidoreductase (luciferase family)
LDIGIGSPAVIPGASGQLVIDWARKADEGPFSSLGLIDRIVYPNFETMTALAASAGATRRIRLMTAVLLAPLRETVLLAKQAASLDALSNGRFTLGVGVGGRQDDYVATGMSFENRGRRFEEQIHAMKRIWAGQPIDERIGPIGPPPATQGGPELLIGGHSEVALRRSGRLGDGFIASPGAPDSVRAQYEIVERAWNEAGRSGKPRFVMGMYYGLGADAQQSTSDYIHHYYGHLGPVADQIANSVPISPVAVKGAVQAYKNVGLDEIVFWPCIGELNQIDRLVDLVGQLAWSDDTRASRLVGDLAGMAHARG